MPTYEYRCNACRRDFEYQQKMADDDLVTCEACGEPKLEKLISRSAFQLKGSGWYKDLYSSNPAQAMKDSVDKVPPPKQEKKDAPAGDSPAASPAASTGTSDGGSSSSGSSSSGSSSSGSSSGGSSSGGSSSGGSSSGGSSSSSSASDS